MADPDSSTTRPKLRETARGGETNQERKAEPEPAMHWHEKLSDGTQILIRPIHNEDDALERAFIERLSPQSRGYRFFGQVRVNDELVRQMTHLDWRRQVALVALRHEAGEKREIGVARFCIADDPESCECAIAVSDEWQHKGLGTLLMRHLIELARVRGIKRMVSIEMTPNVAMRNLAESLGFQRKIDHDCASEIVHTLDL